jgi:hypothetical protein
MPRGAQGHNRPKLHESWLDSDPGDGALSVRVRPSSLKRDCDRRATSTGGKCLVNVHAKSRLTLEPLRTLRSEEDKGQTGACPDRTRAIPCKVRVGLLLGGLRRVDSNGDSNRTTNGKRQRPATAHYARTIRANLGYVRPEKRTVVRRRRPTENLAYALRTRAPEMPPNCHQQPTTATSSNLRT